MNAPSNLLVDSFGRKHNYLRISVTDRCNLRCLYCMPAEGITRKPKKELLTYEEICRLARIFVSLGIEKIRITGGEPLVRPQIEVLVQELANIPGLKQLALTTNAVLLAQKAEILKGAGIQYINISLDSLEREKFRRITLRDEFDSVLAGIDAAQSCGFVLKLNVVVMKGRNEEEILDFVHYVKDRPINVRFIEYMPFKGNSWDKDTLYPYKEIKELIEKDFALVPLEDASDDVAKNFHIGGHQGKVSFITSMTDSFCSSCKRLRLTADGSIKSCLFYDAEINLKDKLRNTCSDGDIEEMILYALLKKPESHPPVEELASKSNRAMVDIGG